MSAPHRFTTILALPLLLAPFSAFKAAQAAGTQPTPPPSAVSQSSDAWKGAASAETVYVGVLSGVGLHDGNAGFALQGTFAGRIVENGFVPDINNEVFLEGQIGPLFIMSNTALMFGAHLRWDFEMNKMWRLYGLGGVGSLLTPASMGSSWQVYPRFGTGVLWSLASNIKLRAELSHEVMGLGLMVGI
jgi:hypothetical protein